jgi:hypothetical protein
MTAARLLRRKDPSPLSFPPASSTCTIYAVQYFLMAAGCASRTVKGSRERETRGVGKEANVM